MSATIRRRRRFNTTLNQPAPYIRKSRKNAKDETKYLLENIPRELMSRAKTKARRHAVPVKWVLINLLEQWVTEKRTLDTGAE